MGAGMQRAAVGAVLLGVVLGAVGCDGAAGTMPRHVPNPRPVLASELAYEFAQGFCEWGLRCGVLPVPDEALCLDAVDVAGETESTFNTLRALEAEVLAGRVIFDGRQARSCLEGLIAQECSASPSMAQALISCRSAFHGTLGEGEHCVADEACAGDLFCYRPAGAAACEGRCARVGVRCRIDGDCSDGKICEAGSCIAPNVPAGGEHERCGDHLLCQEGLSCREIVLLPSGHREPRCLQPPVEGEPCGLDQLCAPGLRCVPTADGERGTCEAGGPLSAGSPCDVFDLGSCGGGLVCVSDDLSPRGTCVEARTDGDACARLYECGGLFSTSICDLRLGYCVPRPQEGACAGGSVLGCDPRTSYCDLDGGAARVCRRFKGTGEACTADYECGAALSGVQCGGGKNGSPSYCKPRLREICEP